MIAPIPMLKVKNAWPIAAITTEIVIFEKSASNKKLKAFKKSPVKDE